MVGTRSTIAVVAHDGMIEGIYCHFDGYLDWVGCVLAQHYNSYESAMELIGGGNLYSLDTTLEKCEFRNGKSYFTAGPYSCDELTTGYLNHTKTEEFNYLFMNGEWFVKTDDVNEEFFKPRKPLSEFGSLTPLSNFPCCDVSTS